MPTFEQVYIERMGCDVEVVRRNSNSFRRIVLHGSDGTPRSFMVHGSQALTGSEEKINSLMRAANHLLSAEVESRRRLLSFSSPNSYTPFPGKCG